MFTFEIKLIILLFIKVYIYKLSLTGQVLEYHFFHLTWSQDCSYNKKKQEKETYKTQ